MVTKQVSSNIPAQAIQNKSVVSSGNANGVINITLELNFILIHSIQFSYSASPTGGRLAITDGTNTFDVDLATAGPAFLICPLIFTGNVTATIYAGGASIVGKLNIQYTHES